jgi:hypothetical protein
MRPCSRASAAYADSGLSASKCRPRSTGRPSGPRSSRISRMLTNPSSGVPNPKSQRPKAMSSSPSYSDPSLVLALRASLKSVQNGSCRFSRQAARCIAHQLATWASNTVASAATRSGGRPASKAGQRSEKVATGEVREASRARAPDSPVPGEYTEVRTARPDGEHLLGPFRTAKCRNHRVCVRDKRLSDQIRLQRGFAREPMRNQCDLHLRNHECD